jgi:hypothetical protein
VRAPSSSRGSAAAGRFENANLRQPRELFGDDEQASRWMDTASGLRPTRRGGIEAGLDGQPRIAHAVSELQHLAFRSAMRRLHGVSHERPEGLEQRLRFGGPAATESGIGEKELRACAREAGVKPRER